MKKEITYHIVTEGESLEIISSLYDISVNKLILYNNLTSIKINEGQQLLLEPTETFYTSSHGTTPTQSPVYGCTDSGACNYDASANHDDGSCDYSCKGCTNSDACNYDASATTDDGSCEFSSCKGCTDSDACNYDPDATKDDGSCRDKTTCISVSPCPNSNASSGVYEGVGVSIGFYDDGNGDCLTVSSSDEECCEGSFVAGSATFVDASSGCDDCSPKQQKCYEGENADTTQKCWSVYNTRACCGRCIDQLRTDQCGGNVGDYIGCPKVSNPPNNYGRTCAIGNASGLKSHKMEGTIAGNGVTCENYQGEPGRVIFPISEHCYYTCDQDEMDKYDADYGNKTTDYTGAPTGQNGSCLDCMSCPKKKAKKTRGTGRSGSAIIGWGWVTGPTGPGPSAPLNTTTGPTVGTSPLTGPSAPGPIGPTGPGPRGSGPVRPPYGPVAPRPPRGSSWPQAVTGPTGPYGPRGSNSTVVSGPGPLGPSTNRNTGPGAFGPSYSTTPNWGPTGPITGPTGPGSTSYSVTTGSTGPGSSGPGPTSGPTAGPGQIVFPGAIGTSFPGSVIGNNPPSPGKSYGPGPSTGPSTGTGPGTFGPCNAPVDCSGECGGGRVVDCAGVCGAIEPAKLDCAGNCWPYPYYAPFTGNSGFQELDCAGICGGDHIIDCSGACVKASLAKVKDCAGVCGGTDFSCKTPIASTPNPPTVIPPTLTEHPSTTIRSFQTPTFIITPSPEPCDGIRDCEGVCNGGKQYDCEGVCGGGKKFDCAGECGGKHVFDSDGVCGGTKIFDCEGISGGTAIYDCKGICNGPHRIDCDGNCINKECEEGNFSCSPDCEYDIDCLGICNGHNVRDCAGNCRHISEAIYRDADGVCGGDNLLTNCTQLVDCAGVCGGKTLVDCDGVCGGTNFNCDCKYEYDCKGVCGGSARVDCLGVCGGSATYDCLGVCNGNSKFDCSGLCGGLDFSCGCTEGFDCEGTCNGTAKYDRFNICKGNHSGFGNYSRFDISHIVEKNFLAANSQFDPLCPEGKDPCGFCGGDFVTESFCPETPIDFRQQSCEKITNTADICGYTASGDPVYVDACGTCFGSVIFVKDCPATPTPFIAPTNTQTFSPCDSSSCGYDLYGNCYTLDVCGQCGGPETDPANCTSITPTFTYGGRPVNDCNYWKVTWESKKANKVGVSRYSAWVRDPRQESFLFQSNGDTICYRPDTIIGPMCPPDNFIFYGGGYSECPRDFSYLNSDIQGVSKFGYNPFDCDFDPSITPTGTPKQGDICGINSWGRCKIIDVCGNCDGGELNPANCPGYTSPGSYETPTPGLECNLVKGIWQNSANGDVYVAWFDLNSVEELNTDFYHNDICYTFAWYLDLLSDPGACVPPDGDVAPLYTKALPACTAPDPYITSTFTITPFIDENPFDSICISSNNNVTVQNGIYNFNSAGSYSSTKPYSFGLGTHTLTIPQSHPIFLEGYNQSEIRISGTNSAAGTYGTGYYGKVIIEVLKDFNTISYKCAYHGYMGGLNNLIFDPNCTGSCDFLSGSTCNRNFAASSFSISCSTDTFTQTPTEDYKYKACVDPYACNYDKNAIAGNLSFCDYSSCVTCGDPRACNYKPLGESAYVSYHNQDLCDYSCNDNYGCRDKNAINYNFKAQIHDPCICKYSYVLDQSYAIENLVKGYNFAKIPAKDSSLFNVNDEIVINISSKNPETRIVQSSLSGLITFNNALTGNHPAGSTISLTMGGVFFGPRPTQVPLIFTPTDTESYTQTDTQTTSETFTHSASSTQTTSETLTYTPTLTQTTTETDTQTDTESYTQTDTQTDTVTPSPVTDNYVAQLDGSNDYILADGFDPYSVIGSGDFTFSIWVNRTDSLTDDTLLYMGVADYNEDYVFISLKASNTIRASFRDGLSGGTYFDTTDVTSDNTWHHIALTREGTTAKIYLDGNLARSFTHSDFGVTLGGSSSGSLMHIGSWRTETACLKAKIDDAAIWDDALTQNEITAIYNSGSPTNLTIDAGNYASSANLQGYWRFNDNTVIGNNGTIADSSGNNRTATTKNGVTFVSHDF